MLHASEKMQRCIDAVAAYCDSAGILIDETTDPNRTGLIGPAYTDLTTTVGIIEAKRTSAVPDMAALIVYLLRKAGVRPGDTIAVGCSASFPALLIAVLSAADAMDVTAKTIISLGSSSYGATRSGLTLLHMYEILLRKGLLHDPPAAVTLGGKNDTGEDFFSGAADSLTAFIESSGYPFFVEPDLERNVARRMEIYFASGGRIAAFINAGGGHANIGTGHEILNVEPGLNRTIGSLPPTEKRGVLFAMAADGVPVVHLLYLQGLAQRHGLPWDPVPLPEPGTAPIVDPDSPPGGAIVAAVLLYCAVILSIFLLAGTGKEDVGTRDL